MEEEEINRISHILYRNSSRALVLSLYGGRGGNYIEQSMRGKLEEEEGVDGGRFFGGWGGAKSNKSNANNESECVGKGSMCRDTFFSFLQCPFTLCGGAEELFFLSSFKNQPPVEKVRWRPSYSFFPGKKGQKQPSVSPTHQHGFRIQDNRKTYSQERGAEGRKKQEADSDFAEKVHFLLFSNFFFRRKNMTRPSSHPKLMCRVL